MVIRQNILRTDMRKNDKLSIGKVRLHLATLEICQARNLWSNLCISTSTDLCAHQIFADRQVITIYMKRKLYRPGKRGYSEMYCQNGQSNVHSW